MGTIVVSENVSLDGVVQDPTGEEGFARGGWFLKVTEADRAAWGEVELQEALRAQVLLLGRNSDRFFGSRWTTRTGPFADRLNSMPKYVLSSTLDSPVWSNSTILAGDAVSAISELKASIDGEILVYASRPLVHALVEHSMVDELRLMVYPVLLGAGDRLFPATTEQKQLRLLEARTVGTSLAYLTYGYNAEPEAD